MRNNDSYDEERVFQKLEHEALRHHHSSSGRHDKKKIPREHQTAETQRRKQNNPRQTHDPIEDLKKHPGRDDVIPAEKTSGQDPLKKLQDSAKPKVGDTVFREAENNRRIRQESYDSVKREREKHKPEKKKKRGWMRICAAILAVIILIGSSGAVFLHSKLNKIVRTDGSEDTMNIDDEFDEENPYGLEEYGAKLITSEDVTNILLIGQDRRKGDAARMRSDAMIICSINQKTGQIILTSLMRDMYLPVPGKGYGMINATYLAGGFELLNETIKKNFGIQIDGNVEVDFDRFIGLMTLIGPIELNLSREEADHLRDSGYSVSAGNNQMNSEQVLAYCRMRKNVGGDWGRTDRQRKVLAKIYQKLRKEKISTVYSFIDEALPLFRTDLSNRKIIQLAYAMVTHGMRVTKSYRIPEEGTYTQEIREEELHVLIPDLRKNSRRIQNYIYGYMKKEA